MIYLIDDNRKRQQDSGWINEKFEEYKDFVQPIYRLSEVTDDMRNELFRKENNVILLHESFFENHENRQANDVNDIRNKLIKLSNGELALYYVIFSGSNSERKLNENRTSASMPVHILYNNLEMFINHFQSDKEYNLKYLLYGSNPEIESFLLEKLIESNRIIVEDNLNIAHEVNDYFFFRSKLDVNPISDKHDTIYNKDSEFGYHNIIKRNLSKIIYKGIFIPLCFGNSLSDYNGLRLATEIRCTNTINQCVPIFIYSFVRMEYLLQNEYFNILKTKCVELVDYDKKAFQCAASSKTTLLETHELHKEIKKLELQPPKNYLDNHSIANEWAIHQWAKTIGCDETEEISKIFQNVNVNLYFKYLRTLNPISELDRISPEKLKFKYEGMPKVLLIDDEAYKGWFEIFAHLFGDINGLYVDYLGVDYKTLSSDEIIEKSIDKIFEDDIDVVILDFRLNPTDFEKKSSEKITGVKLLKEIKDRNPGVQVIAFSATNKVWNLKDLESESANGFISKGGPYNNDGLFINSSVKDFIKNIQECIRLAFLKNFYKDQNEIANGLIPRRKPKNDKALPKDFIDEALKWLSLSNDVLSKGYLNEAKIVSSFIIKFSVLENISSRVIDTDNQIYIGKNNIGIDKYKFQFRLSEKNLINFIEDKNNIGYYRRTNRVYESNRNIPWVIKILNTIDFITNENLMEEDLTKLVKKRNDFIHANPTTGDKVSISIDDLKFLNHIITLGLKNIV